MPLKPRGPGPSPGGFRKNSVFLFELRLFHHILCRMKRYFDTENDIEEVLEYLPEAVCPHCGARGALVRHDNIWRSGGAENGLRGKRVFCDNRKGRGCGGTVAFWLSDTLRGRCLRAAELMRFILGVLAGSSVWKAWKNAETGMTIRTGCRTFTRFVDTQSVIRTELFGLTPPTLQGKEKTSLSATLKILKETLGVNAVSAYQKTLQKTFP